jgi:hypothetical protein
MNTFTASSTDTNKRKLVDVASQNFIVNKRRCFKKLSQNNLVTHYEMASHEDDDMQELTLVQYTGTSVQPMDSNLQSSQHAQHMSVRKSKRAEKVSQRFDSHERALLESLGEMYGVGYEPSYYDLTFEIRHQNTITVAYATKAILFVACNYFTSLSEEMQPILIDNVEPSAFALVLTFCYTGKVKETNPETVLEAIRYCQEIEYQVCENVCMRLLEDLVARAIFRQPTESILELYVSLSNYASQKQIYVESVLSRLSKVLIQGDISGFFYASKPLFIRFPPDLLRQIITSTRCCLPEEDLFDRVFEWGVVRALAENLEEENMKDEDFVYAIEYNEPTVKITQRRSVHQDVTKEFVSAYRVRQLLNDILPEIQFENIPVNTIVNKIAPKMLFESDEMLEIIQASVMRKSNKSFTLLNRFFDAPRVPRTTRFAQVPKISINFSFRIEEIVTRDSVHSPEFMFAESRWYIMLQQSVIDHDVYLAAYLCNRDIQEEQKIENLKTRVTIGIKNKKSSVEKSFDHEWSQLSIKGWGSANILPISELTNEQNDFIQRGLVIVQVEVQLL